MCEGPRNNITKMVHNLPRAKINQNNQVIVVNDSPNDVRASDFL